MKSLATTQLLSGGTRDVVLGVGVSPRFRSVIYPEPRMRRSLHLENDGPVIAKPFPCMPDIGFSAEAAKDAAPRLRRAGGC